MERATGFDKLKESDRGCVIIMGAILEEDLRRLHIAKVNLISAKSGVADTTKIDIDGRLSNFAVKIFAAFECGLITAEERDALDLIRNLRNEAAHLEYNFRFEDDGVEKRLSNLRDLVNPERTNTERAGRKRDFLALTEQLDEMLKDKHKELVQEISTL